MRGSKSEDQLAAAELDNNSSEEERILINSSCHTLLDPDTEAADTRLARLRTVASAAPQVSSESSSSRSLASTDTAQLPPRVSGRTCSLCCSCVANGTYCSKPVTRPPARTSPPRP